MVMVSNSPVRVRNSAIFPMPSIAWNKRAWPANFATFDQMKDSWGYQWGDPHERQDLRHVIERFIRPYVNNEHVALEIGPGAGRWTQFLIDFKTLYLLDVNDCFFDLLKQKYPNESVICLRTNGNDLPFIRDASVDFLFSFGTFVHIDPVDIELYLKNIKAKLTPTGVGVIHYADKTKPAGLRTKTFSYNTPDLMRALVRHHGFRIVEEDLVSLSHSSIIRFMN